MDESVEPKGFDDFEMRLGDLMRGERATLGKSLLDVQRELKIKATYIAAIENTDPTAFETPGFIAGYVRSYARYLDMDPEWAYKTFCAEARFETAHGMSSAAGSKKPEVAADLSERDLLGNSAIRFAPSRGGFLSGLEPGAIGSIAVLAGLIGVIGYGGYAVLNEVQKVQFVPVDQTPGVIADLDPLAAARATLPTGEDESGITAPSPDAFDRLYRPQALDVPILVARDGPIATLDPKRVGTLVPPVEDERYASQELPMDSAGDPEDWFIGPMPAPDPKLAQVAPQEPVPDSGVQVVAEPEPEVVLFAVRPSWVRVRAADGTVLYEKIMEKGDRFVLPQTEQPATLRTGESGAIYFAVNGETYGPAGRSGQVTKNLKLGAASLTETYDVADLERDNDLARVVAELEQVTGPIPSQD